MELEPSSKPFEPPRDERPRMLPPPPVRLVAIEDVLLVAQNGIEKELDDFYARLLRFERHEEEGRPVYEAENFRVRFDWREGLIERGAFRLLGIEVESLALVEEALIAAEMKYLRSHGLLPGEEALSLQDPAGNWVELREYRIV